MSREHPSHLAALGAYVALALAASVIAVSGLAEGADPARDLAGSTQVRSGTG